MVFFIFLIIILCMYKITIYQKPDYCSDYLSKENCMSVRGIFVLLIVASHFKQYVDLNGIYDTGYLSLSKFMSQTVVVMFLFYSGYGVYLSIKKYGYSYIKAMPVKRILITFVNLIMAILCFLLMNALLDISYDSRTILLSFIGWTSIGNSNWYIFAILYLYIASWLAFFIFRKHHSIALATITFFSFVYMIILRKIRPTQGWCYNTIFCYSFGMWYAYFKESIERFLFRKNSSAYYIVLIMSSFSVLLFRPFVNNLAIYELWALAFTATTVLITMKVSINNPILLWLGKHTFEIYMLQRIPMIILKKCFHLERYPYIYFICVFFLVIISAYIFGKILYILDSALLRKFTTKS